MYVCTEAAGSETQAVYILLFHILWKLTVHVGFARSGLPAGINMRYLDIERGQGLFVWAFRFIYGLYCTCVSTAQK